MWTVFTVSGVAREAVRHCHLGVVWPWVTAVDTVGNVPVLGVGLCFR